MVEADEVLVKAGGEVLERRVTRPNSFIYTLFGDVIRQYGGEIWIGSLTELMAQFGVGEQAVRAAVSRMLRQGWLVARKVSNRAFYALSERGVARVDKISQRIYFAPEATWDRCWRMFSFRIPETERAARDRLRKDLTVLGLAPLSPSLWISPRDVLKDARESATALGLSSYIETFIASGEGPRTDTELLERCWDISAIAEAYREFIRVYSAHEVELRGAELSDAQAFVEREWLVHEWRRFVYRDPSLPIELLPGDWPAIEASNVFRRTYELVKARALRHFESILVSAPDPNRQPPF